MAGVVYPTFEASEERHDILADGVLEFTKDRACEGPFPSLGRREKHAV
jgi:hypothetical protein